MVFRTVTHLLRTGYSQSIIDTRLQCSSGLLHSYIYYHNQLSGYFHTAVMAVMKHAGRFRFFLSTWP
jgi:hypothetical protein